MRLIIDSSIMREKFKKLRNQDYFVDKSNIINKFNDLINKDGSQNVCITKLRRFEKTSIASLLAIYYSKGIDSLEIFNQYEVSKGTDPQELFDKFKKEKIMEVEKDRKDDKEINKEEDEEDIKKEIKKS